MKIWNLLLRVYFPLSNSTRRFLEMESLLQNFVISYFTFTYLSCMNGFPFAVNNFALNLIKKVKLPLSTQCKKSLNECHQTINTLLLRESTCARVSFLKKLQAQSCNFVKKETLAKVFFRWTLWNFWEHIFYGTPSIAPSEL